MARRDGSNIDHIRAVITRKMLEFTSKTLEYLSEEGGLTMKSAQAICEMLLPGINGVAVAITDTTTILGYAGVSEDGNPSGRPIRTQATRDTVADGEKRIMLTAQDIGFKGDVEAIQAAIIVPLKISKQVVGTLKFYYSNPDSIDEMQQAIAEGFGDLISTQFAAAALEEQRRLTTSYELKALQAQINPHFLFNTLNTISAFIRMDPDKARKLLREFAVFYRKTLENSDDLIELSRELEQTQRYFGFELARFGEDKLSLTINLPEELAEVPVPAFMVQPIVENGVRHARHDDGTLNIVIDVHAEGDDLYIVIADDGVGMSEEKRQNIMHAKSTSGLGIAVRNINDRVTGYFAPGSSMSYESEEGKGTTVTLYLKDALVLNKGMAVAD
ncbi:MAG: histidine kinase [Coriobacteriaceae bacterium]|nr:histidine kinase [Coriobacteriaceae bacterium]